MQCTTVPYPADIPAERAEGASALLIGHPHGGVAPQVHVSNLFKVLENLGISHAQEDFDIGEMMVIWPPVMEQMTMILALLTRQL